MAYGCSCCNAVPTSPISDFGLQTAVGRYFAYATEKNDFEQRIAIFSTAFVALVVVALLSVVLLFVIASLHLIFPSIPVGKIPMMQWSLFILGISLAPRASGLRLECESL